MTASRSARERKAAEQVGPLGKAAVHIGKKGTLICKVTCKAGCTVAPGINWSTHRSGQDNGYIAALDRWTLHLHYVHPDSDAPCLAYLQSARERVAALKEARAAKDAELEALFSRQA